MAESSKIKLSVSIGPLTLQNPVTVASGTFGYGQEYVPYCNVSRLGAVVVKGINRRPRVGHNQPRLVETASGLLNCIGLQNVGVDEFIREKLPFFREMNTACIVNVNGSSLDEYIEVSEILDSSPGVDALEINISCPNVKEGGITFGVDPVMTERVTREIRNHTHLPLIVKLSPNVTDITTIAKAAACGGADALSLINTLLGMAIDPIARKPRLSNVTGGLSGPAIKPVALRCVWQVHQAVQIPLIGMGGICNGLDAVEFLIAGASAVSVGTASFTDPAASEKVLDELIDFCVQNKISDISTLIGSLTIS
ncbi:dihydroorotate dehydrogenase [bacterium]|nr:dihydroorotate dehydrogenase [candidate division CSSED10-310 bacterium]